MNIDNEYEKCFFFGVCHQYVPTKTDNKLYVAVSNTGFPACNECYERVVIVNKFNKSMFITMLLVLYNIYNALQYESNTRFQILTYITIPCMVILAIFRRHAGYRLNRKESKWLDNMGNNIKFVNWITIFATLILVQIKMSHMPFSS